MTEIIDAVSAALDKCGQERGCRIPAVMLRHLAVAAIAAMRDPTDRMLNSGAAKWDDDWCTETNALHMWQGMIDEALK